MQIKLDELNTQTSEQIIKLIATIPNKYDTLELIGDFNVFSLVTSSALLYLPKYIKTVKFSGTCGSKLSTYTAVLPATIDTVSMAFELSYGISHIDILIDAINSLNKNITSLDLSLMKFSIDSRAKKLFECIPPTITAISFNHYLHCIAFIQALPRTVTRISVKGQQFFVGLLVKKLDDFLNALSPNLEALDLSECSLFALDEISLHKLISKLPPKLIVLGLSNNYLLDINVLPIEPNKFVRALQALPKSIEEIDWGGSGWLSTDSAVLKSILHGFPPTVRRLRLSQDSKANFISGELVATKLRHIPPQIDTLIVSGTNLFGLTAIEFIKGVRGLPHTITTLDFSDSGITKKSFEELSIIFANLPAHIRRVKLCRNKLISINFERLSHLLHQFAPHIKELDFSNNGFDSLLSSQLNLFLSLIPKRFTSIMLDNNRFAIQNDGTLVSVPPTRNYPGLFKPQGAMSHQKEFARLRLVLMQLFAMNPRFPLELISSIVSQAIKPTTPEELRYWENQLSKRPIISSTLPKPITPACQEESRTTALERIDAATAKGATRVDLSRCGLNRLNQKDIALLFETMGPKITELSLRGNGLGQTQDTVALTIQVLAVIPKYIKYLDLSANGFELYTAEQLTQLFSHIRPTVALVSLGQEKPLHPTVQIAMRQWPSSYKALTAIKNADMMHRARALLVDYTKGDSAFMRFLHCHWNRNHAREVTKLIKLIDMKIIRNMNDLMAELELIDKSNDTGSFAKRMSFLLNLSSAPEEPHEPKANLREGSELKCLCFDA